MTRTPSECWSHPAVQTSMRFASMVFTLAVAGCDRRPPGGTVPPPPSVEVAKPLAQDITEWDEYTGRLGAIDSVDVRARVSGFLESIHFKDGQLVKKDDLLFVLDARPFQAALDALAGEALQAESRLELARNDLERARKLIATKAISQEDFDTRSKTADVAQATVRAAKARAERARLDLEFTEVRAPMPGRIARHLVSVGNLVSGGTADSTVLANIVTVEPVYCYFDVSEQAFLKYVRMIQAGLRESARDKPVAVEVALLDEPEFTHPGHIDFVDNQIDNLSGTLRGRALLEKGGIDLLPGAFVKLRLPASPKHRAILLPDRAISSDQSDRFVFVLGEGNVAKQRRVVPGRLHDGLRVILTGLDGSEAVVVSGVQRIRVGAAVTPEWTTVSTAGGGGGPEKPAADPAPPAPEPKGSPK